LRILVRSKVYPTKNQLIATEEMIVTSERLMTVRIEQASSGFSECYLLTAEGADYGFTWPHFVGETND
jgi:hypothetical protein